MRQNGMCTAGSTRRGGLVVMKGNGSTLIELLIVMALIGLLATIAIPKLANTKERAQVAALKSDLRNLVDRKSTRLNSSHLVISYAVFCLKKKNQANIVGRSASLSATQALHNR